MLTRQQQAIAKRHRALKAKFEAIKRHAEEMAARAREVAGPHGVILDAETYEPIRTATEAEAAASVAAATETDPVGPIMIEGREVFAMPPWLLVD